MDPGCRGQLPTHSALLKQKAAVRRLQQAAPRALTGVPTHCSCKWSHVAEQGSSFGSLGVSAHSCVPVLAQTPDWSNTCVHAQYMDWPCPPLVSLAMVRRNPLGSQKSSVNINSIELLVLAFSFSLKVTERTIKASLGPDG